MRNDFLDISTGVSQVVTVNSAGAAVNTTKLYGVNQTIICKIVAIKSTHMTPSVDELKDCTYLLDDIRQLKEGKKTLDITNHSEAINSIISGVNGESDKFSRIFTSYESGSINASGLDVDTYGYVKSIELLYLHASGKISVNVPISYYIALHCWDNNGLYKGILRGDGLAFITSGFTINSGSEAIETIITTKFLYDLKIKVVITNTAFGLTNPKIPEAFIFSPSIKVYKLDVVSSAKKHN